VRPSARRSRWRSAIAAAFGFTRNKREGDDMEAITRLFAPEFRNRLDAIITFAHLSPEIIAMVVEKFVLQLEAQLADRDVTIELTDEATGAVERFERKAWNRLIDHLIKLPPLPSDD
jgi:ATP-dependent Clp protease ATP-binding subunit ClpA